MAGTFETVVKVGLVGLVGYWVYRNFFASTATATTTTGATAASGTTTTATTATTPTGGAATAAGTTSAADAAFTSLVASMQAAAAADAAITIANGVVSAVPNVFNVYLVGVLPALSSTDLSPGLVFPGTDATKPITAAQYWAGMAPFLAGKSLMGLGRLGAAAMAHYRRFRPRRYVALPRVAPNYIRVG